MGVYTTLAVSRDVALAAYARMVLGEVSDEVLEEALDRVLEESLHNVRIAHNPRPYDEEVFRMLTTP